MTYTLSFVHERSTLSSYPSREPTLEPARSSSSKFFTKNPFSNLNLADRYTTPSERYTISDISSLRKKSSEVNSSNTISNIRSTSQRTLKRPQSSTNIRKRNNHHLRHSSASVTNNIHKRIKSNKDDELSRVKIRQFYNNKMETREKFYRKQIRDLRQQMSELQTQVKSSKVELDKERVKTKQILINSQNNRSSCYSCGSRSSTSNNESNSNTKNKITEEEMRELNLKQLNDLYNLMFTNMVKVQSYYAKRLIQKHKETIQSNCVVCLTEIKDCLVLPCRHICTCEVCAEKLSCCPVCRKKIQQRIKVYV